MRKFQHRVNIIKIYPLIFAILVIHGCTTNKENQPMSSQLEKKKKVKKRKKVIRKKKKVLPKKKVKKVIKRRRTAKKYSLGK